MRSVARYCPRALARTVAARLPLSRIRTVDATPLRTSVTVPVTARRFVRRLYRPARSDRRAGIVSTAWTSRAPAGFTGPALVAYGTKAARQRYEPAVAGFVRTFVSRSIASKTFACVAPAAGGGRQTVSFACPASASAPVRPAER